MARRRGCAVLGAGGVLHIPRPFSACAVVGAGGVLHIPRPFSAASNGGARASLPLQARTGRQQERPSQ
eukprot:1186627-Prorocentrum_minimum.AAC.1